MIHLWDDKLTTKRGRQAEMRDRPDPVSRRLAPFGGKPTTGSVWGRKMNLKLLRSLTLLSHDVKQRVKAKGRWDA